MNLSQRQLQAFLEIAHLRSFTRAAERLHITQSGLSAMMRDLEAQLDGRLFERTTRSVVLTAAGTQLVPVATRVLQELDSVSESINNIATRARRILAVGATPMIAASVMPSACRAFAIRHPEVSLKLRDIGREEIQDGVANGDLDVGFGVFFKPTSGIERTAIAEFPLAYVCPAAQEEKGNARHTRWEELRDKPLIGLPPSNPIQELIEKHLKPLGRGGEERPVYENFQTILAMVEAGFGAAILPSFIAAACERYRVKVSILSDPVVPLNFFQITRKGSVTQEAVADLAASIRQSFALDARIA